MRLGTMACLLMLMGLMLWTRPVQGQELVEQYWAARFKLRVELYTGRYGRSTVPLPPQHLATPADTIGLWLTRIADGYRPHAPDPEPEGRLDIHRWRLVEPTERLRFRTEHKETLWAFLGSNALTSLDTTRTAELRARLEATFGPPTQTLVDLPNPQSLRREEYIQFEYWFVLNDSIPLMVMDVNGPFERGLVVASDHRYRAILFDIRSAFLQRLMVEAARKPYIDYYYHYDTGAWYQTGYDGERFFQYRIRHPDLSKGRPQLNRPSP